MMKLYFISGHRDITMEEFNKYYIPKIEDAIKNRGEFVVGDYVGVDIISQNYLKNRKIKNVTVYHMFNKPMNNVGYKTVGGFITDEDRDRAMTLVSDIDIAWVRNGKELSGTQQNIDRRKVLKG
jgi:hypothetical protein